MKKWKERGKRIAVLLLTAALVGSSVDLSALTVNAAEEEKVLTCEKRGADYIGRNNRDSKAYHLMDME
ncbi:hypothetical protein RO1_28840 [Roseburia intestinalis XB6B4]|uniref:Uncharacterized protein n=1 Tax=Roseburia intestinalis XB6B4 TaxID=718255 RepID=D4L0Y9_9FIRM|nr:hypothetical protein [Roseburia intestinalis]CBL13279.1 hypothetical protein RO1_28840 [Roseburia intestinalis XB6B4]